jgi:hypothetical protein
MSKAPKDAGQLFTHRPYMKNAHRVGSVEQLYTGDVVQFTYKGDLKYVFVLDPIYKYKMHGLSLTMMPRQVLVSKVIGHMDQTDDPYVMYNNILAKNNIPREYDAYRTYITTGISSITRYTYHLDSVERGTTDLDEEQKVRDR